MGEYIASIRIQDLSGADEYLDTLPVVKNLSRIGSLNFNKNVTFLIGENGIGKSTLLEAIATAYGFNAEGGGRNFSFSTQRTHSNLGEHLRIVKKKIPQDGFFLRAESFYNVATEIDNLDHEAYQLGRPIIESYGGKSLHQQSHGESFLAVILNRFGGNGIYILDEPEAALSPTRQMTLISQINHLEKKHSQLIIATHSPILLAYPNAEIYELTEDDIQLTPYQGTEHFRLTKQFLDNPQRMLNYLLED